MMVTVPAMTFVITPSCIQVLYQFLQRAFFNRDFKNKTQTFQKLFKFIQISFKERKLSVNTKRMFFSNFIWPE